MNEFMAILLSDPVMLFGGLLTHYLFILSEISGARKTVVTPWAMLAEKPYKVLLSFIGSVLAYAMIYQDNPSPVMVFAAGYMANDALDRLQQITHKTMQR